MRLDLFHCGIEMHRRRGYRDGELRAAVDSGPGHNSTWEAAQLELGPEGAFPLTGSK